MADLSFLQEQEDSQEELDGLSDEYGDGEGDLLDFGSQEESLSPLARMDKYLHSDNIFNRQMVARSLVDTLRMMGGAEVEVLAVVERVYGLAQDAEPSVRVELMEQLPQLVMFCHDNHPQLLPSALNNQMLPALLSHLADPINQVRKTAQAALLVLLEQEVMTPCELVKWVCPVLVELSAPDSNDDVKTEAMAMMCKMAPLVGREVTEKLFLPRFCELCCDCRMFHVRKVCAANFGDMCTVVGGGATEELLLPRFFQLCGDNVWGVRKACAECFMTVSAASSADVRRTKLASLFINLITDPSRWVRQAAFQSLGQFISTFDSSSCMGQETSSSTEEKTSPAQEEDSISHNPPLSCDPTLPAMGGRDEDKESTNALHTETPHIHSPVLPEATHTPEAEERKCTQHSPSNTHAGMQDTHSEIEETDGGMLEEYNTTTVSYVTSSSSISSPPLSSPPLSSPPSSPVTSSPPIPSSPISSPPLSSSVSSSSIAEADMFNSFHFWRTPLPVIDLDQELLSAPSSLFSSFSSPSRRAHSAAPASSLQTPDQTLYNQDSLPQTPLPPAQSPESLQTPRDNWESTVPAHGPTLGRKQLEELIENLEPHIDDPDVKAQVEVLTAALRATIMGEGSDEEEVESEQRSSQTHREGRRSLRSPSNMDKVFCLGVESDASDELFNLQDKRSKQQDVVPQALLDQYLSMTEPSRAQTVDMEIAKHCAYSLPGVARTLGRHNWHCLRDTYETLASDMQWKVRRTLAFSIHELALILGEELTSEDLLPVFNSFLKDLDEVRVGVLKHLYDFLKLLGVDVRRRYLYQLQEFLVTDNSRNWRFRSELSEQLVLLLQLYSGQEVFDFLRPLAFSLCCDRVSSVRWTSYKLVSEMMRKLAVCHALLADFLSQLVNKFCHANKWSHRQTFTTVCQLAVEEECVSLDQFSEFLLLPLLRLAGDPVPNVRVLLAKTLQRTLLEREYFVCGGCVHKDAVQTTLSSLQSDTDRDVQYYATHSYTPHTSLCDDDTNITSSTY